MMNSTTYVARTLGQYLGLAQHAIVTGVKDRLTDDRGEGVISMAIAILVIAALGVAMFAVFEGVGEAAGDKATDSINSIGS